MQLSVISEGQRPVQYAEAFHVGTDGRKTRLVGNDWHSPGRALLDLPAHANLFDPVFDKNGERVVVTSRHETPDGAVIFIEIAPQ